MNLYAQKDSNIRKTWILMAIFLVVIIALGWFLSYEYQSPEILLIALVISVGMNLIGYWFSDKIVLGLAKAKLIEKKDNVELFRIVENLSITAGLPTPKIYILPEKAMNAFATGRNANHSAIAVTQGLLDKLDKPEIEGVIAHELSHIGNRDTLLQTIVVVLVGLIVIVSNMSLRSRMFGFGGRRDSNSGQAESLFSIIGLILLVLSPIIGKLIQLAISRKREFLADASAALFTRYPEGLASALTKISADGESMKFVSNATAHLYINSPLYSKSKSSWLSKLFLTHPPVEERIKVLRNL